MSSCSRGLDEKVSDGFFPFTTVYQPVIFGLAGFDASKAGWVSGVNTITYMFST